MNVIFIYICKCYTCVSSMKKPETRENFIYRDFSFDIAFARYHSDEAPRISESLNEKQRRLEAGTVSYRILNHWEQKMVKN